ncbi:MAG: hypothetical protein ACOVOG_10685, partial [Rubrivivax sp.]
RDLLGVRQLSVTIEEFYGDQLVQNIALLLGIDPSRIKIVSVHAGSVDVVVEIADNKPSLTGPSTTITTPSPKLACRSFTLMCGVRTAAPSG